MKVLKHSLPILIVVIALTARLLPGVRGIDDASITFRYARNLLSGNGFVFNPGEQVQGTTTPLYTLVMAAIGAAAGGASAPFPQIALLVNTLADCATCYLLLRLGRRLGAERIGLAAALLWAVEPYSVTFAIGGLETSLFVLLLTGTTLAYVEKRRIPTALCAILAILTRPDAVLLVGPLILDRLFRAWRRGENLEVGEVLTFLLPGLAWGAFATWYFGSPIPHSVIAKLAVYRLEPYSALIRLLQHYALPFLGSNMLGTWIIAFGLVMYPFLFAIGARRAWRLEPRLLPWLLYPWLYFLVFSVPNPLIFRWYLTPPLPPYLFIILLGTDALIRRISIKRLPVVVVQGTLAVLLLFMLPLTTTLSEWTLHPDHGPQTPAPRMAWFKLELLYQQAARELAPHLTSSSTLAAGDVGMLGYFTPARILDTVGLNSPQSLRYYPLPADQYVINYAIPTELILQQNPDFIVILEVYARNTFLQDKRFAQAYRMLDKLPTDIYGSDGMLIFERK
jgi:hypothetical protein